ncbi:hypothetical protein MKX01_006019 [Papaver californicum]|nr:hypothetical protein MKX01_006019 [Papaver californicum]
MGDYRNPNSSAHPRQNPPNRANVLQSKLIGQSHPTGLTSNLLKLFEPRPPLEYKPPPEKRKSLPYSGMSEFVAKFTEPGDPEYLPPVKKAETAAERRSRVHKRRLEEGAKKAAEELEKYEHQNIFLNIDACSYYEFYLTIFEIYLHLLQNYETTEHRIKREFEAYGPIKRVRTITDRETNKPRGYAFIEYMHTRDMKSAYKQADGRKVDTKRVLVDVERGRTVPNWRPRRLGGGLGSTRVGGEADNQKYSGREPQQVASGGTSRSEEPRSREDRHDWDREKSDREKSRERGRERDKERERSRERSYDRPRDRDSREEKHHRDRNRDKVREKDRGRDKDRNRDHDRERGRDYDRDSKDRDSEHVRDRGHERPRKRDREYDYEENDDQDRGRSRDRNRRAERDREYDRVESEDDRERFGDPNEHKEPDHENGQYDLNERGHEEEDGSRNYNWDYGNY